MSVYGKLGIGWGTWLKWSQGVSDEVVLDMFVNRKVTHLSLLEEVMLIERLVVPAKSLSKLA